MDAFYASIEQRDNRDLRGKPVAVGGSRERSVVAAASYEARKFGIRSAMPSISARRQCPDLIFVKPRFDVYREVSLQIRAIFAEYTEVIEPLSLDEAYLDVTENLKGIPIATQIAAEIRAKIRAETGLTASAGISYNKFLAKLASDRITIYAWRRLRQKHLARWNLFMASASWLCLSPFSESGSSG
jgi:DNA polymerase-4